MAGDTDLDLDVDLDDGCSDSKTGVVGAKRQQFPRLVRHVDVSILDQSHCTELFNPERYQPRCCTNTHVAIIMMGLFRTVNHDVIRDCCKFLEFTLPSDHLVKNVINLSCDIKIAVICISILVLP